MIYRDPKELFNDLSLEDKKTQSEITIPKILAELKILEALWREGGEYYQNSLEFNLEHLDAISELFSPQLWQQRIDIELGDYEKLDRFKSSPNYEGRIHYAPLGKLLHITASNVVLGMIDSFLMGVVTKNINIIKLSSETERAGELIASSIESHAPLISNLCFFISYRGGELDKEKVLFENIDAIIAWGGEEMINSVSKRVPPHVKLIKHGPKISFHVITLKAFNQLDYSKLCDDITMYDQQACANSQNIFLEKGIDKVEFAKRLNKASQYSRVNLDPNSAVELLKEKQLDLFREFKSDEKAIHSDNLSISYSDHLFPEPSALNGHVRIKCFKDVSELAESLSPFRTYLQTCGLLADSDEREIYMKSLGAVGVNRFTSIGKMLVPMAGSPHDGEFNLLSLTTVVADEEQTKEQLRDEQQNLGGFLYGSGGTTGDPKFSFYSNAEFDLTSKILSEGFSENGLLPGDRVGNLFAAGNLWSSFNAIQKALEKLNVIQLPFGAINDIELFKTVAIKFPMQAVFGLPSLLADLAKRSEGVEVKQIFFAGEPLLETYKNTLEKCWKVEKFSSAGYASVDAGPIGYQDPAGEIGDHILYDKYISLEIKDGQGYVTSKLKCKDSVLDYPTGDKIEILPDKNDGKTRFRLLGRADRKINIWSARFEFSELETIMDELDIGSDFQIQLSSNPEGEILTVVSSKDFDESFFVKKLSLLRDIKQTRDYDYLLRHVRYGGGNFLRNSRTGKIPKLIDLR